MNKKNENNNLEKTQSVNEIIAIFQPKIQKNQNKEDVNNIRESKKNKDFPQTNNIKKNIENNEEIIKSKDSNIVKHLDKKENLNKKVNLNKKETLNKKENLNKKKSNEMNAINEKNNEKKEEGNSFENKNLKENKNMLTLNFKKGNQKDNIEVNIKPIDKINSEKIFFFESNNNINVNKKDNIKNKIINNENEKKEQEQDNNNINIKDRIKLYNNISNNKNKKENINFQKELNKNIVENKNVIENKNIIKVEKSKKETDSKNLDSNKTIENALNNENKIIVDDNKGDNSSIQNKKENIQKENEKNQENNIRRKVTFFSKKNIESNAINKINDENNKNQFQTRPPEKKDKKSSENKINSVSEKIKALQQRILFQKQNSENNKYEKDIKYKIDNNKKENKGNININDNLTNKGLEPNQIGESNNNKFENINSQRKEKNFVKLSLNGMEENSKEKKNSNNEEISFSRNPKKLNLDLIFKNLNINSDRRKEIIEVAQHNIEEENKMELKEKQIECDNEIDNEENENEEEEIEERNINNRISIDKDKQEEEIEEDTIDNIFPNVINEQEKSKEDQNEYKNENLNISNSQNEEDNKIIKNTKVFENNKTNENNTLKRKRTISENNQQLISFLKKKLEVDAGQNNSFKENVKNESRNINENNNCENSEINNEFNINNQNLNLENKVKSNTNLSIHMNVQDQENENQEKFNKSMGFNFKNDKDIINEKNEYLDRPREFRSTLYFPSFSSFKSRVTLNEQNNNYQEKIDTEEIFLEKLHIPKNTILKNKTFCESFFLTSFPKKDGKLIDNSESYQSECKHFVCSLLPAMQPEIIYKYPKEDIKGLEINNLAASICFPNGIKVCYQEDEESIKTVKNYRSSFTNQVGERFFAVIYHFYLKMKNCDFEEQYEITPINKQISIYQDEHYTSLNDEQDDDILKKLTIFENLYSNENVYVPYCLCLISKYPFIKQMEKCLESIMISINNNENPNELNKLITYIIKSIPSPPNESKIFFPLPYTNQLVEIQQPYFRDITEFGDNPLIILKNLSVNHIICLFKLLIFEQKILVVGKNNDLISQIILNFISLLYPFEWIHTFIPIMSEKMLKFLQSFLPFFNGINESLFSQAKIILQKAANGVFIFDVDNDKIDLNNNLKNNNKHIKSISYINKNFQKFPKNLENLLMKELKSIKSNHSKAKRDYDKFNSNLRIKFLFIYVLVELLEDYKKYSYVIEDFPVFNSYLMIKEKKSDKKFFKDFTSTQLFQMFIQNSLFKDGTKMSFFEETLNYYYELKKTGFNSHYNYSNAYKVFHKEYLSFFQIKKLYIIKPFFLKEYEKLEEEKTKKNKAVKLTNIYYILSQKYESEKQINLNFNGILKENRRIIERPIELNNSNDPEEYDIFVFPGENIENLKIENKKKNSNVGSEYKKTKSIKMGIISEESDNNENKIKISQYISSNEKDLDEYEKDEIKDNIREIMTRIYRSDLRKLEEDKKNIMNSMEHQFGREYFVNILNIGNISNRIDINVVEGSYNFFGHVIFNTLLIILKLEENEINLKYAMKLLKTCLYIKTIKNKKEMTLSNELYYKLENYSFFKNKIFWKYWIEDDMTPSDIQVLKKAKKLSSNTEEYIFMDEEMKEFQLYLEHSYKIIEGLSSIMMKLKLKNNFIYSIISDLSQEYIINEKDFQDLMVQVLEELHILKLYSKWSII